MKIKQSIINFCHRKTCSHCEYKFRCITVTSGRCSTIEYSFGKNFMILMYCWYISAMILNGFGVMRLMMIALYTFLTWHYLMTESFRKKMFVSQKEIDGMEDSLPKLAAMKNLIELRHARDEQIDKFFNFFSRIRLWKKKKN